MILPRWLYVDFIVTNTRFIDAQQITLSLNCDAIVKQDPVASKTEVFESIHVELTERLDWIFNDMVASCVRSSIDDLV